MRGVAEPSDVPGSGDCAGLDSWLGRQPTSPKPEAPESLACSAHVLLPRPPPPLPLSRGCHDVGARFDGQVSLVFAPCPNPEKLEPLGVASSDDSETKP